MSASKPESPPPIKRHPRTPSTWLYWGLDGVRPTLDELDEIEAVLRDFTLPSGKPSQILKEKNFDDTTLSFILKQPGLLKITADTAELVSSHSARRLNVNEMGRLQYMATKTLGMDVNVSFYLGGHAVIYFESRDDEATAAAMLIREILTNTRAPCWRTRTSSFEKFAVLAMGAGAAIIGIVPFISSVSSFVTFPIQLAVLVSWFFYARSAGKPTVQAYTKQELADLRNRKWLLVPGIAITLAVTLVNHYWTH